MKKINYIISIIVTIIVSLIFIPVKIINLNEAFYGRTTLWNYLFINNDMCTNCHTYRISWIYLIIQTIIVFLVCIFLLNIFDKKRGKK